MLRKKVFCTLSSVKTCIIQAIHRLIPALRAFPRSSPLRSWAVGGAFRQVRSGYETLFLTTRMVPLVLRSPGRELTGVSKMNGPSYVALQARNR